MRSVKIGAALAVLLAIAGCSTVQVAVKDAGNDAPVGAGLNVPAGSNEDFIVNVGRRIFFEANSAAIGETSAETLGKQAEWLGRYPAYKIKIEGFADEPGSAEANRSLGLKRAEAAKAFFASKGIAAARMRVKSFGNSRPVRKCEDVGCVAQNRRVVTVLDTEIGS